MDSIVKFTIGLFIFSIFLLFFKITKKLSLNYQTTISNNTNSNNNQKQDINQIDASKITWKIDN
tara:strand:- start:50 stop:241 length:192 start_codon:yes stop_codon:yes gene_type:complete